MKKPRKILFYPSANDSIHSEINAETLKKIKQEFRRPAMIQRSKEKRIYIFRRLGGFTKVEIQS